MLKRTHLHERGGGDLFVFEGGRGGRIYLPIFITRASGALDYDILLSTHYIYYIDRLIDWSIHESTDQKMDM